MGNPSIDIFQYNEKSPHLGSHLGAPEKSVGNTDMIVGLSELRHLHIYIAYKEETLYLSPAVTSAPAGTPATSAPAH
jgi:hypothetical protein